MAISARVDSDRRRTNQAAHPNAAAHALDGRQGLPAILISLARPSSVSSTTKRRFGLGKERAGENAIELRANASKFQGNLNA